MNSMISINKSGKISLRKLFPHRDTSIIKFYFLKAKDNGEFILSLYDGRMHLIKDLPPKKLICTKNLVAMTKSATNRCWDNAMKSVSRSTGIKYKDRLKEEYKDQLDNKYRELICRLDTDVLEAILLCHNKGKLHRAKITLQTISDEIARRTLLNDSSRIERSDSK